MPIQSSLPKHCRLLAAALAAALTSGSGAFGLTAAETPAAEARNVKTCTGTVYDDDGSPMIGASVMLKGAKRGTTTDVNGRFTLPDVPHGAELQISCVGCTPQTVRWTGQPVDVTLLPASTTLGEVVVTAMGIQRKESSLTYATQQLKSDDIMKVQDANFANALSGKVAGVTSPRARAVRAAAPRYSYAATSRSWATTRP